MHHWVSEQFRICELDVVILVQISLKFFLKNLHLSCHYPSYWDILFIKFFNSLRNFCLGINLIEIYQTYNFFNFAQPSRFLGTQFEVYPFFCISLPEETFLKAGLEVHGFLGFELKFYVTVYRIVRSSYQTDLAWNYRAKYWSVQSFYF